MTFVLQEHHCLILQDWIEFLDWPVTALIVHVGQQDQIRASLGALCACHDIQLHVLGTTTAAETTTDENPLLAAQFAAVQTDFGCVVRLDNIPFRQPDLNWQDPAWALMQAQGARFLTGTTLPYRADRPLTDAHFALTQRISNGFLMIRPADWLEFQRGTEGSQDRYGRFSSEGAAEDYVAAMDIWGLRLLNSPDIRIFHCHEWGPRLPVIRDAFRKGTGIGRFLKGFQDDYFGANARFYMKPRPPLMRRARIFLGHWRRRIAGR
ncbi:hypothetical protein FNJ84_17590 [Paracoccus sp. M683]|uniref:hypothetical protein n=1 Tax=Paracoccus sp. M683 TaxID=2594268 RepID=UPI001197A636|nr:hypothetical protein [Paracoccus sp. M683]TRW95100.1 hypothetical protein FNJ84_17590 [Paracoccus sp. M683]